MKDTCNEKKLYELDNNYCLFLASKYFESIEDYKHLELSTTRALNNINKFHYNPIPLTEETRRYFDHLQTLYFQKTGIHFGKKKCNGCGSRSYKISKCL